MIERPKSETSTSETPEIADWAGARGEKWRGQLPGLEGMLAPVDGPLLGAAELEAAQRIADIGCGGGGTTFAIARDARGADLIHGFDISPALIEAARARMSPGDDRLAFSLADLGKAAPPHGPYDRLVSRFGIMFYEDPPEAFANLSRWLKPGGRFAFSVWGPPEENPWMTGATDVAADFIEVPPCDLDAPGPFRYAGAGKLCALLDQVGFGGIEVRDWQGKLPLGGGLLPDAAVDFVVGQFVVGELLADRDEGTVQAVRRALAAHFADHLEDGAVWMKARVHIVTGSARAEAP